MTEPSVASLDAAFNQSRQTRLDGAISAALASKVPEAPPPPKAPTGKPKPAASAAPATASDGSGSSTSTGSSPALSAASPAAAPEPSLAEPAEGEADLTEVVEGEPQDGSAEAAESAFDRDAITALAKKGKLRDVEKALGLEEGVLGTRNGDYAALRRREEAVEGARQQLSQQVFDERQKLIEKFGPHHELTVLAQKGDLRAFAGLIQRTTGMRIEAFIQHWAQNVTQVSPRELELERRLAQVEGQRQQPPPQAEPQTPDARAAALGKVTTYLAGELTGHLALKLPGGADEVRAKWLANIDPATRAPRMTPQAAADAVLSERRTKAEQERWLLSGKEPPKKGGSKTVQRRGSTEARVLPDLPADPARRRESAIEFHAAQMKRGKAAERARVR